MEEVLSINRGEDGNTFEISFQKVSGADDVVATLETSTDLSNWRALPEQAFFSSRVSEDGFGALQINVILTDGIERFYRLDVSSRG